MSVEALLDADGVAWREPWIEPLRDYTPAGGSLEASCAAAGADPELGEFARKGLIPPEIERLYAHQERALTEVLRGRNLVITAGTGSGKTEAFLLPILADLLAESQAWTPQAPRAPRTWWEERHGWAPQREGERGRHAAIRALVLYPMNALVEDQLVRLRRALDCPAARGWLADHRPGHRFYFGSLHRADACLRRHRLLDPNTKPPGERGSVVHDDARPFLGGV